MGWGVFGGQVICGVNLRSGKEVEGNRRSLARMRALDLLLYTVWGRRAFRQGITH